MWLLRPTLADVQQQRDAELIGGATDGCSIGPSSHGLAMPTSVDASRPEKNVSAETARAHLQELVSEGNRLQESLLIVKRQCRQCVWQQRLVRCLLMYLGTACFLRRITTSVLGWHWAGVLIGATVIGGITCMATVSWRGGLLGLALGAGVFACLMYIPHDPMVAEQTPRLRERIAELDSHRNELSRQLAGLTTEFSVASERQRQWSDYLNKVRELQQYRLNQLALRNWKAMRGGDLEQFLAEVFSELRYSVERTGQAGDQGVDLILLKGGHRIAVQVKGYVDSVPNTAIQEAFTGMVYYKCEACAVITNSRFTSGGRNIAGGVGCALIDEDKLPTLIMGHLDLWQETLAARTEPRA